MIRISALKEASQRALYLLLREDTVKTAIVEPG